MVAALALYLSFLDGVGSNVQIAVCDEIASHKTSEVYDVLLTAMGKRRYPMLLAISTVTGNNVGIGKQLWDYAVRVLEGAQADERLFALIYSIDAEDDPWEEGGRGLASPDVVEIQGDTGCVAAVQWSGHRTCRAKVELRDFNHDRARIR